jgi:hypothetical protein
VTAQEPSNQGLGTQLRTNKKGETMTCHITVTIRTFSDCSAELYVDGKEIPVLMQENEISTFCFECNKGMHRLELWHYSGTNRHSPTALGKTVRPCKFFQKDILLAKAEKDIRLRGDTIYHFEWNCERSYLCGNTAIRMAKLYLCDDLNGKVPIPSIIGWNEKQREKYFASIVVRCLFVCFVFTVILLIVIIDLLFLGAFL